MGSEMCIRDRSCRCMEGSLMRGWELILPEVCWLHVRSPANQRSAGGTGVFTPCGAISTRGIYVFVPRLSELKRCGRISNPEMRWKPILSGVRWLYVRSPANRPGSPVSSPGCRSCKCMEGFMIRGWDPVFPGWCWLYSRDPANQRSAGGVGVSTPCGAVSTRGITIFVPGLSEL